MLLIDKILLFHEFTTVIPLELVEVEFVGKFPSNPVGLSRGNVMPIEDEPTHHFRQAARRLCIGRTGEVSDALQVLEVRVGDGLNLTGAVQAVGEFWRSMAHWDRRMGISRCRNWALRSLLTSTN